MSNLQFKPNTWAALTYNTTFMHFQICISIKFFLWHKEVVYTATKYDYIFFVIPVKYWVWETHECICFSVF